jgi:diguanylate cyclase (GGDEF)-like protein
MGDRVTCPVCSGIGEVDAPGRTVDQHLRDRARAANDRDQRAGDRKEAAAAPHPAGSDHDHDHPGVDEGLRSSYDAEEAARLEDEAARWRLETAEDRDHAAELRDRGAEGRDLQARMREVLHDDREGAEDILLRAGRDRAKAADDRARAAADRTRAAAEREEAARDRADAVRAQAEARREAQHNLVLAASDEVTGALTRRFGLTGVTHELDRAGRTGGRLVLAAIEVDHLEGVEQARDQPGVDRLLRYVGDGLKANIRSYDLIVRYRDDGFLCAMPGITRRTATKRLGIVAAVLTSADTQHAITFGVAEYEATDEFADLLGRADTDLLAARRASGRG